MNTIQRIARNMAFLFTARVISLGLGFFYVMLTARYLGPNNYGILAFALALNGIFGVIANFGLDPLTVREVARKPKLAGKYLSNGITIKLLFGVLAFVMVAAVVNVLGYPSVTRHVVYIITLSTVIAGINNLFNDIYQAFERMEFTSLGQILQSAVLLILTIVGVKMHFRVVQFALMYLLANLIVLVYNSIVTTLKFLRPGLKAELNFWWETLREAWPFALTSIFVSIYYWIDSVMLSYMKGNEVVGWYNAAYRLILILLMVPGIYFTAVYPLMSRFFESSKDSLRFSFERSFKYLSMLAFPLGVGTTLLADRIILLVFGPAYLPAARALQVLVWSVVCIFLSQPYGQLVRSTNNQKVETKITAMGAVLNTLLNLLAIPRFSYVGASWTTLITEFFVTMYYFKLFYRTEFFGKFIMISIGKTLLASAVMGVLIISLLHNLNIIALILIAIGVYFVAYAVIRGFDPTDFRLLKLLLKEGHT